MSSLRTADEWGHLFRHESGRMAAALTRVLGVHNLDLAEDVVQETLLRAVEVWRIRPMPENPAAWLMQSAKNRAVDVIRRERTTRRFADDVTQLLQTEWTLSSTVDSLFDEHEIRDDLLRMMFSCCHPSLRREAQVTLILRILCGFSAQEIARAFLVSEAAVEKRLTRARAVLRKSGRLFEVAGAEQIAPRLDAVHGALYLLFNEGYHSAHPEHAVREDLCQEALRLALMLDAHPAVPSAKTRALVALFCFHAGRLGGRVDGAGRFVRLERQDRTRWDADLIEKGKEYLLVSWSETEQSAYHVEASIAAQHCLAPTFEDTDWAAIVALYDRLLALRPTPVVALNRAIAVSFRDGPEPGLEALRAIEHDRQLDGYSFFAAAEAELLTRLGRSEEARSRFQCALDAARTPWDERILRKRLAELDSER